MAVRVGIVIPSFNDQPGHLEKAIASAITQDVPVEIVVVNDGSTDPRTLEALAGLPDGVKLIHQANSGPAAARNAGISNLSAPYILPLDADDWVTPGYARRCGEALDSGARIAAADMSHGTELFRQPERLTLSDLIDTNRLGSASAFRRTDWESSGGYDESLRLGSEDYEFWVRLLALGGEARRIEGEVFHHRVTPGSRTEQQQERLREARRQTRAAMARNSPAVAGPALDRIDELLREVARLNEENLWWRRRFGGVRRVARLARQTLGRR